MTGIEKTAQPRNLKPLAAAIGATLLTGLALPTVAQGDQPRGSAATMLEEVTVTARKREESSQDVPLSVTAFNSDQVEALKIRDLSNMSVGMPNVSLEDSGTVRGVANFSIRGLGIASSIPSIDPTVGVFSNGVYLGMNWGVIFDMFDVESVEVLRGPQGTLFGRNVTGGAVLINNKKPGDELEASVRVAADIGEEGGTNSYLMGAVGGPLSDNLAARLVVYYNDDEGRFENLATGNDHGGIEQKMARGTLVWTPGDRNELTLRYEYSDADGDGPAGQTHLTGTGVPGTPENFDKDSFDYSIDEEGFQINETNFFTAEYNRDVDFGDGTITAIYGYREFQSETMSDIDSQPVWLFHAPAWMDSEQNTFELRYNGYLAERANVTVGGFYFDHDLLYHERRNLLGIATGGVAPALTQDGGGNYQVESYTVFAQVDYELNESWTLTAGVNYSSEEKDVKIASLNLNVNSPCNIVDGPSCPFDFVDDESWDNWAPKLGVSYLLNDDSQLYAHWTRGYRSGGYNLRNTDPTEAPGPFDEEEVNNYEFGYKSTQDWGRLNAAVFYSQIDDQQREVNLPSESSGVLQLIKNTADTTIWGVEVDGTFSLTENLILLASIGYTDASYDKVRFDLNGDGVVDGGDKALELPRAPELTWSLGLSHDLTIGDWGYLTSRATWSYRDEYAYTDNNLGYAEDIDMVDAGLDLYSNDGHWVFSLYGRNLLDEASFGGITPLPADLGGVPLGGSFSPLNPGRRYGLEVTYNFF
ncbi:TonB-dependent receptor [Seongchinamella unica]|uniref:TonB-dependent receptor n=1 Tax=Seongchinamella unica TaxID=2547392 RepID=A0A4R5LP45_9GAMM|nr:TonB-dependent receptor [Seongchinamella unica]TDG12149.1 TonB-dependent receptor [Seongchinamella unica]